MSHQVDPFSAPCPRGQLAEALGHPLQGPDARRRWKVPGGAGERWCLEGGDGEMDGKMGGEMDG